MQEILEKYQVRKSNKEKTKFICYLKERLSKNGYKEDDCVIEERWKGPFKTRNIIVGNPEKAKILLSAHYDTPAVSPFPNFMFPTNYIMFVLFQAIFTLFFFIITWLLSVPFAFLPISGNAYVYIIEAIMISLLLLLMFGPKNRHCANDNTSGVIALIKILETLPIEERNKVCVIFFDNEEKGLFGSVFFAKKHKKTQKKLLINMDCVGDGNRMLLLGKRKARKDKYYDLLNKEFRKEAEEYKITFISKPMKPLMFASDQANFDKGIGVCALKKGIFGLYAGRIHTPFDRICEENNINYLNTSITNFIKKIGD